MRNAILLLAGFLVTSEMALASETFTLYGTGFSNTGTELGTGSQDGNWTLESAPSGACDSPCASAITTPEAPYVTETGKFPFTGTPEWIADTGSSEWVSPFANEDTGDSDPYSGSTPYVYETTFDLTGLDPNSVVITGEWTADNYGYIVVNGTEITSGTDGIIANTGGQFTKFFDFVLDSSNTDFQSGVNTIEFYVFNNSNGTPDVTGVDVDIESDFADPVPEPGTLGILAAGLVALGLRRRSLLRIR